MKLYMLSGMSSFAILFMSVSWRIESNALEKSRPITRTYEVVWTFPRHAIAIISLLSIVSHMLETNSYVRVIGLDFSKAFDSICHDTLMSKMAKLDIPDNIYNFILNFFEDHSHCTSFQSSTSSLLSITAGVIQGSAMGPASYVITASDLNTLGKNNELNKYADDTYLIVPSSSDTPAEAELDNIAKWASTNNLKLNASKSTEIVFMKPRCKSLSVVPAPIVGIKRVKMINILGVSITNKSAISEHVSSTLASCSQSLFALRTLRFHGMPPEALQAVFKARVLSKLLYCSPAWWGFATATDLQKLEAFLKRCIKFAYYSSAEPCIADLAFKADISFFQTIEKNSFHVLFKLLPQKKSKHGRNLRPRKHDYQVPPPTIAICDKNFINRMLTPSY